MFIRHVVLLLIVFVPLAASAQPPRYPLDEVIAELKEASSPDVKPLKPNGESKFTAPLIHLGEHPVNPKRRAEVSALLDPLLKSDYHSDQSHAVQAVVKWGTPANVPNLISLLETDNEYVRHIAIMALGKIGGKNAAAAVGKHLAERHDQPEAARALKEMGSAAEPIAWQLIETDDVTQNKYGCEILGAVGGSKSLVRLKALRGIRPKNFATSQMDSAIHSMEHRLVKR
jgi:hypothetical protein